MSYDAVLQRVNEIRSLTGAEQTSPNGGVSNAAPGAFNTQLAAQQAAISSASNGNTSDITATVANQYGLPVLTVADQYRLSGLSPLYAPGFNPGGNTGARMVQLAQQELGVSETSGNNESPRIREYRSATAGAEDTPGPWCSYFVSWLAREAGSPIGANGNGTGYVPTLEAWGKQEGRFVEHKAGTPSPGDIVIFNWGGQGVADHTGIVESVDSDGTIRTIEGNSSDAVRRRSYPASTSHISGFIRMS